MRFLLDLDILFKAKAKPIGTVTGDWKKISNKKWKYIGHGHQGTVYRVDSSTVVKVSKRSQYHKSHGKRTPKAARNEIDRERKVIEANKGNPLIPEYHGTWKKGKNFFLVREDITPLKEEHGVPVGLTMKDKVRIREGIEKLVNNGFHNQDNYQFGRDKAGNIKLFDVGFFYQHNPKDKNQGSERRNDAIGALRRIWGPVSSKKYEHVPTSWLKEELRVQKNMLKWWKLDEYEEAVEKVRDEIRRRAKMKIGIKKSLLWSGRAQHSDEPTSPSGRAQAFGKTEESDKNPKKRKKAKKIVTPKKKMVEEHKKLVAVLRSPSHKDDLKEAKKQSKELKEYMSKAYGYTGPMSVADITLASWNEFFREGGSLNQPIGMESNRLKKIQNGYFKMARLHSPLAKARTRLREKIF